MNDNERQAPRMDIVVDCELDAPPDRVWRALTEPELLATWLLPNDFRPEPGYRFAFAPDPRRLAGGPIACEVLDLEPERRLRLSWRSADAGERDAAGNRLDSVVTFDLERTAGGTRLRIAHTGFPARLLALREAGRRLTTMLALQPVTRLAA
jgi:uncharacterized protein YndB with AHSA1/START domain